CSGLGPRSKPHRENHCASHAVARYNCSCKQMPTSRRRCTVKRFLRSHVCNDGTINRIANSDRHAPMDSRASFALCVFSQVLGRSSCSRCGQVPRWVDRAPSFHIAFGEHRRGRMQLCVAEAGIGDAVTATPTTNYRRVTPLRPMIDLLEVKVCDDLLY